MIQILPAILAETPEQFKQMVEKVSPFASVLHLDTSDGVFTDTKFIGPDVLASSPANIEWSAHLMVQNPENIILSWLDLPNVKRIIFHIETTDPALVHKDGVNKTQEIIDTVHNAGKEIGIALNPETNIEAVEPFMEQVDFVQFMSVHPGQYGAEFLPDVLNKVSDFHIKHPNVKIAIDGGVNPERIPAMQKAGVSIFISGGYIMNSDNPEKAIAELKDRFR
ncbi:MAG: hypothetical protein A2735_03315 [Candidatus Yanofskybacteria bacterium RIFCSPHIGHO2_01_FULL_41_21]|uniref:Ribulose-phosphate 3-epimerase n=1 Tax=Candidatus Yanofskybacteria bacterium RIFCSPHIGHO2_01_FULL_41_21 TaxID=1802660 RepID=A0A1F8E9A7_9BACT|nr:MAG: hypothetical protein A2735_03315 [Candidatus Yanofskybacteria bacterium RIFCSPHIGHO2_01_FULL_41_21]